MRSENLVHLCYACFSSILRLHETWMNLNATFKEVESIQKRFIKIHRAQLLARLLSKEPKWKIWSLVVLVAEIVVSLQC